MERKRGSDASERLSIMGKPFFEVQKRKWKEKVMIESGGNEGRKAEEKKEARD